MARNTTLFVLLAVLLALGITSTILVIYWPSEKVGAAIYPVSDGKRWGFANAQGKLIIKMQFEQVGEFCEGLAAFRQGAKWGYLDSRGAVIIKPIFDECLAFSENLAAVQLNGMYGFADQRGEMVIQPRFAGAGSFSEGLSPVVLDEQTCYIDKTGKPVIQLKSCGQAYPFSEGRALVFLFEVQPPNQAGFNIIDRSGRIILSQYRLIEGMPYFESSSDGPLLIKIIPGFGNEGFSESTITPGHIFPRTSGPTYFAFMDEFGKVVIQPKYDDARSFAVGFAAIELNGRWGFIDRNGSFVIQPKYDDVRYSDVGFAAVELNGRWGFIDRNGSFVIQPVYDVIEDFAEDLAAVKVNNLWGYINKTGHIVIEPFCQFADQFQNGYACVVKDQDVFIIDKQGERVASMKEGKLVMSPSHSLENLTSIPPFPPPPPPPLPRLLVRSQQPATALEPLGTLTFVPDHPYSQGLARVCLGMNWGFVDLTGTIIIPLRYEDAYDFREGLAAVELANGKYGFIDHSGRLVIKPIYDKVRSFLGGVALVLRESRWRFVDSSGRESRSLPYVSEAFAEAYMLGALKRNRVDEPPVVESGVVGGIPGGIVGGIIGGVSPPPLPPSPRSLKREPVHVESSVQELKLIKRVEPVYPELAKRARISATVTLEVTIDEEGNVVQTKVLHGHPMFDDEVVLAVGQWKYSTTLLDGRPIPVVTTITVTFK